MSWFYAVASSSPSMDQHKLPAGLQGVRGVVDMPSLRLWFGGVEETCLFRYNAEEMRGWGVVGGGIREHEGASRIMSSTDWQEFLSRSNPNLLQLDGHFVAIRWNEHQIEFFTDQLGLRRFYYGSHNGSTIVSTRVDLVAQATGENQPDLAVLGSRWLTFNQLSCRSPIRGIGRSGASGHLLVEKGRVVAAENGVWSTEIHEQSIAVATRAVESVVQGVAEHLPPFSLALSGGLDSRFLLAVLLNVSETVPEVHTLADPAHPDVVMAAAIARELHLEHQHIYPSLPDPSSAFDLMSAYAAQAGLIEPATTIAQLRYGEILHEGGRGSIDGGFGEIGRRSLFKRLATFGKGAVRSGDIQKIFRLLKQPNPPIFTEEVLSTMEAGAKDELAEVISAMPSVREIGMETFVDLFALRTRIPNYGGPEQSRVDAEVLNLMPLLQPSYVRAVINAPVRERLEGRFYRRYINRYQPLLAHFPLVKGGATYRYGRSTQLAWLTTRLRRMAGQSWSSPAADQFLQHVRVPVLDLLHSSEVRSNPLYNAEFIMQSVEGYYKGDQNNRGVVDWWLAFELWQRAMKR